MWDRALAHWRTLKSDPDAKFDREVTLDAREIKPHVTWGTSPEMVVSIDDRVPDPDRYDKMLELAEALSGALHKAVPSLSEEQVEELGIFMAKNRDTFATMPPSTPGSGSG